MSGFWSRQVFGEGIDERGRCGDPSDLVHRRMLVKMVTHIEKVKNVPLLGRHRCRSDADVVERLAVCGHPDGEGEVLREPRLSRELGSQWNVWGHIAPLPIASEHDLGEDFPGE